jgi:monovalent cation:H+ antiporter-2, CPA2 family
MDRLNTIITPTVAAGTAFLPEVVALLVVSALIAYLCYRVGLVPIVGFLLAGVVMGPGALGLVHNEALIEAAAEVGIILLLFTIGIEFSLDKLGGIRRLIFLGGGLQVGLVIFLTTGVFLLLGVSWQLGVYTGFLLALSSTAVVMKLLADRGETSSDGGQISLGILIFQDLAVVAMVLLVPMLAGGGGGLLNIGWALFKAAGIIAAVLLLARRIMPHLLEAVARTCSQEIFLLTVIAICLGTAYLTNLAGVSLSLGAFLAGLLVSESRFSGHALGEILPLQVLFSATFFVSVGLLLDVGFVMQNLPLVLALASGVMLLKIVTTGLSVLALGYPVGTVAFASLMLAQVGEFSLVLERTGRAAGLAPAGMGETGIQALIAATVVLMVLTPFLAQAAAALEGRLKFRDTGSDAVISASPATDAHASFPSLSDHIIIAGYGAMAEKVAQVLQSLDLPFLILTLSPAGAASAEDEGMHVIRGDYSRRHTLGLAGIERARALVIADDEPGMMHRVISLARLMNPSLSILARTRLSAERHELAAAGATHVVAEDYESVASLLSHVLDDHQVEPEVVEERLAALYFLASSNGSTVGITSGDDCIVKLSSRESQNSRCSHLDQTREVVPQSVGCEECLQSGDSWVHLRVCMSCGHVGCCDSSRNRHARRHFIQAGHPVVKSMERGEDWAWCFADELFL